MPTFTSSDSYSAPSYASKVRVTINGVNGQDGEDSYFDSSTSGVGSNPGGAGGNGGYVQAEIPLDNGRNFTLNIGGGAGGGGAGGDDSDGQRAGGDGGNGGGRSEMVRDSDNTEVVGAGGGGGGGGGGYDGSIGGGGGGGGGGAEGGGGGAAGQGTDDFTDGSPGGNAADSGTGGNGGDGGNYDQSGDPGANGGAFAFANATNVTTTAGGTNDGSGSIQIEEPPTPPSLNVSSHTNTSVELDIGDTSGEDGVRVYYREVGSSTWIQDADLGAGVVPTTYTVSGLAEGTSYEFYVEAYVSFGSGVSTTVSQTTNAPAPTLDSVNIVNTDELEVNWTSNGTDETAFRVFTSSDGGSTYSQENGDLSSTTTTYTTGSKLDGTTYTAKVVAVYPDTTSESSSLSNTTNIPGISSNDISPVDASIEDQLTVPNPNETDNGTYEAEIRITGSGNAYSSTISKAYNGGDFTFTGLLDGEKYDIRVRAICNDASTGWTEITGVTLLPADTNLDVTDRTI